MRLPINIKDKNKMKPILLLLLSVFLLSTIIASQPTLGVFQKNETVRISQVCSDATYINISSVTYPNSTVAQSNIVMTPSGSGEFYYLFGNTSLTGKYDVRGISDGCEKTFATYFEVTNTGTIPTTAQGGLSIGLILIIMLMVLFFGVLSFKFMENDTMFPIGLFFLVMSIIFSIYSLFLGFMFSRDFLLSNISGVQEKIFLAVLISLTGIMFIAFTFFIMKVIKELKVKKDKKNYGEGYNTDTKSYNY